MHRSKRRRACSGKPAAPIPIRTRCGGPSPVAPTSPSPSRGPKTTGSAPSSGEHSMRLTALDALGDDRAALKGTADAFAMEALLLIPHAMELAVSPLTAAALEPVVFKGPAVAARYPRPGLRPMEDIDVLLPRTDHAQPRFRRWRRPGGRWCGPPRASSTTPSSRTPKCRRCSSSCTSGSKRRRSASRLSIRSRCGPDANPQSWRVRPRTSCPRTKSWWCSPRTPVSRTTGSSGSCGSPTSP